MRATDLVDSVERRINNLDTAGIGPGPTRSLDPIDAAFSDVHRICCSSRGRAASNSPITNSGPSQRTSTASMTPLTGRLTATSRCGRHT